MDLNLTLSPKTAHRSRWAILPQGRPVILDLVYYTCPKLCNLILNGQTEAMHEIPWTPGKEYEVVTISIDPEETYRLARKKKATYIEQPRAARRRAGIF